MRDVSLCELLASMIASCSMMTFRDRSEAKRRKAFSDTDYLMDGEGKKWLDMPFRVNTINAS